VTPTAGDFVVKPYFWMVIAVVAFDLICYLRGRGIPGSILAMERRLIGFMIGIIDRSGRGALSPARPRSSSDGAIC
jgi:hypothetical protein